MKLTRCSNGHYYDGDMYDSCPHCGSLPPIDDSLPTAIRKAGFGASKPVSDAANESFLEQEENVSEVSTLEATTPVVYSETASQISEGTGFEQAKSPVEAEQKPDVSSCEESEESFENIEDTLATHSEKNRKSMGRIVGWLVSITGDTAGTDYKLFEGNNYIFADGTVSPDEIYSNTDIYVCIEYSEKSSGFMLKESTPCRIFINDIEETGAMRLCSHDIIQIDDLCFIFVALCCRGFSWRE